MTKLQKIKLFKQSVRKWQDYFGLCEWELFIDETTDKGVRANCSWDTAGRIGTIRYHGGWISRKTTNSKEINRVAFHECAELFLWFIHHSIRDSKGRETADEQCHVIIRFLENKILGVEPE